MEEELIELHQDQVEENDNKKRNRVKAWRAGSRADHGQTREHQMSCFVAAGGRRVRGKKATFERLLLRLLTEHADYIQSYIKGTNVYSDIAEGGHSGLIVTWVNLVLLSRKIISLISLILLLCLN